MLYNFYLDGTLVENPVGWDEMITVIRRDRDLKGQFITMDVTFTFTSDGFTYLKNKFDTDGYCSEIQVKIEQSVDEGNNYINFYDGIIKISDVEFMMRQDNLEDEIIVKQYAKTKVFDNSFFSKIFNNRSLKTNLCAGKSKNALPITPCFVQYLEMFDPASGSILGLAQKEGLLWFDVFKYLIEFMTDADVDFGSDLFEPNGAAGGEYSQSILTYGLPIWNQGGGITLSDADFIANLPLLSFEDFFKEIDVRTNLGLYIDNSGSKPKVRIEKWDDLFTSDVSTQISNINSVVTKISVDDIFSRLKLGTTETLESLGALQFPETINYIGFKEEEYIVLGKCNVDVLLDLTGEFITSSNVIEEILINNPAGSGSPNETYNKNFFLIDAEYLSPALYRAKQSNWLDSTLGTFYYNERFTNSNVANNFLKAVPNDIAAYLGGTLDASFMATRTFDSASSPLGIGDSYTLFPVEFNNDLVAPAFDPNGVYNTGTFEFTVPALGAGIYSFSSLIKFLVQFTVSGFAGTQQLFEMHVELIFERYDSFGFFVADYRFQNVNLQKLYNPVPSIGTIDSFVFSLQGSATINLNDGDTIRVRYQNAAPVLSPKEFFNTYQLWILHESNFACTGNTTGGGNYQRYDPSDYPIIIDSFEQELSKTIFDQIAALPLSLIEFSQGTQSYKKGWIDELRYNHLKGTAQFRMLSAKNTN